LKPSGKKSNKSNLGILIIVLIAAAAGYYFTQVDSSNSLVTQIQEKISPQDKTQNKAQSSEAAASKDQKLKFLVRESYGKSFSREERYEKLNNALTSKNLNVQVDFLGLEENTDPAKILDSDFYFENTNIFVKNRDVYKDFKPVYFIQGCFLETQLVVRKDSILFSFFSYLVVVFFRMYIF